MRYSPRRVCFTALVALTGCAGRAPLGSEPSTTRTFSFHDISRESWLELRPGLRVKAVVGEASTFALAEFDPQVAVAPHHHNHEQFNVGVEGTLGIRLGGTPLVLAQNVITLARPNVEHGVSNESADKSIMIEFQPVRRLDLVAPRQRVTFPSSDEPMPLRVGGTVRAGFDLRASGWQRTATGHRMMAVPGETTTLRTWHIQDSGRPVDLRSEATGAEQLVYVLTGTVDIVVENQVTPAEAGTLLIVRPSVTHIWLRPRSSGDAVVVDFHPTILPNLPPIQ